MNVGSLWTRLRAVVVGRPRDLSDRTLFHKVSLVAVLAWVGLGADGLSSSCYGPEESFKSLGQYPSLAIIIALACVGTIAVICASYRQIIELFPSGGGGYLVASKLLGSKAGLVSGSALLVDYVLTIAISIASGADALFSLLPAEYQNWKLPFACCGIALMTVLNLRGVRESVLLWAPIFFGFIITHALAILITIGVHLGEIGDVASRTGRDLSVAHSELGLAGILVLLLRAFSVGAGTYTGIEAVSNGLPVLREPRVETGKRTMVYMGVSLGVTVFGLLLAYMLVGVQPEAGKTLNAVLFERITANWPAWLGSTFVMMCMVCATALLFIAAQAGFLDGPRVLANMALDRWFPSRFATLSDRFVAQNGILLMGLAALVVVFFSEGSVDLLVVLYSMNVFLTFSLSQLGMCVHWHKQRRLGKPWRHGLAINGLGLMLTGSILVALCSIKFFEGGWVTILVTAGVVSLAALVRRHYNHTASQLKLLDSSLEAVEHGEWPVPVRVPSPGRTAILLCNGYNGLGVHTFFGIFRMFPNAFDRVVFLHVGAVDAGSFKGADELDRLRESTQEQMARFAALGRACGLAVETKVEIAAEMLSTLEKMIEETLAVHPTAIVFGGQLAFLKETVWTRWLHNYVVFALQRVFCRQGVPFVIVPIRVP